MDDDEDLLEDVVDVCFAHAEAPEETKRVTAVLTEHVRGRHRRWLDRGDGELHARRGGHVRLLVPHAVFFLTK